MKTRKLPKTLLGNRLLIRFDAPRVAADKLIVTSADLGAFSNPRMRHATVMKVGTRVSVENTALLKKGTRVVWQIQGGQDYSPGMKVVSVLDIVFFDV